MGYFSLYLPTVRALLEDSDPELSKYLVDSNIDEVWVDHDNWNGGIDIYNIVLKVPIELFKSMRKRNAITQTEKELVKCYVDAMRGDGEKVQISQVIISPANADVMQLGTNNNDRMWKPGYFRLFISHLSQNKRSAANLKSCLYNYGISGFVAHEDITPSKEWELEIEAALFSLDALCAIVVPEFEKSQWCDQEIGIALGRKKMVFSIKRGKDPYGFFGKYQALTSQDSANEMAKALVKAICANDITRGEYFTKIVNLVLNASSVTTARMFIHVLSESEYMDKQYVELLHSNFTNNQNIMKRTVLDAVNPLFKKYGLSEVQLIQLTQSEIDDPDLPF